MKYKVVFFFVFLVVLLVLLPTFSHTVRDFFDTYHMKLSNFPNGYLVQTLKDFDTYKSFVTKVDPPNGIAWAIIVIFIGSQLIGAFNIFRIDNTYTPKDTYGSHGTTRWQTTHEIKKRYYKDKLGWFIGSYKNNKVYKIGMKAAYHPVNGDLNMQITVIGSPGSDKTTGYVLPNLFHIPYMYKNIREKADIIVTDPKSELYCLTANYLEQEGYEVRVLDFIHLKYMDSLNCLNFITTEKELIEMGEGYVKSIGSVQTVGKGSDDSFWDDAESQLLSALIGYTLQAVPKEEQTFMKVAQILTSNNVSDPSRAENFFKKAGIQGAPLQLWNNFLMAEDRVRANILIGLATKLRLFSISGIQNITNSTTLDITKFGAKKEKPIALFIFIPDGDRTFCPIINVVVTTILKQLYKTAYIYENKLYNPVYIILEEMANIGKITGLAEMLGTMRGRRIYPMMIWQSLSQMKQRYPDGWEDILSMCDSHIYLGINDEFTSKYASNSLGDTTIKIQGITSKHGGLFVANQKSESQNYQARKLMLPDECKRLNNRKLIMSQRACYPVLINKVQYKYWEDKYKLCDKKDVFSLPRIPLSLKNTETKIDNDVNKITHKDHNKGIEKAEKTLEQKEDINSSRGKDTSSDKKIDYHSNVNYKEEVIQTPIEYPTIEIPELEKVQKSLAKDTNFDINFDV